MHVQPDLPDEPAGKANKFAAKVLLMKCYLNKGVYTNRANPSFDAGRYEQGNKPGRCNYQQQ